MARLRLDRAALNRQIRGASREELETAARQVVNRAKVLAPVDTGRLRASIRIERRRTLTLRSVYTIGSDVEYADMVHGGTRRHFIRPKNGRFLKFTGRGGRTVFVRVVDHPGTRARPFLDRALREVAAQRGYSFRSS